MFLESMKRMKRLSSYDSIGGVMSICPNTTGEDGNNPIYTREFQNMLEGLDEEESCHMVLEKKRRLSIDQVKALEKNFEVENKLEPERKVKLAQELGLQPRQVAVWFQNRRARWKTKQLEKDYNHLKASYDSLKFNFDKLHHHNDSLLKEIGELKSKFKGEVKVKPSQEKINVEVKTRSVNNNIVSFGDTKDGSSDSDSSAILSEDIKKESPFYCPRFDQFYDDDHEHNLFGEESCNSLIFSDDQAPTLNNWYVSDEWR